MNRKYSVQEFREAVNLIRDNFKDVILTADVIVGFPGETEKEFLNTFKFLKEINFYKIHVFKYSQRKGTKAAVMDNQVEPNIKEERSKTIIELSNKSQEFYHSIYQNKILEVLFEEKERDFQKGHTKNYIMVKVKEKQSIINENKSVKIIGMDAKGLIGEVL